jgi:uncharacterized membrane protein (UPF0136 family)
MTWLTWVLVAYGVLLIVGGLIGFRKAKSKQSAISGGICGAIAIVAAVINAVGHPRISSFIIGVLGWAVTIVFLKRYQKTKKLMPAVPLMVISIILANYEVFRFVDAFRRV